MLEYYKRESQWIWSAVILRPIVIGLKFTSALQLGVVEVSKARGKQQMCIRDSSCIVELKS